MKDLNLKEKHGDAIIFFIHYILDDKNKVIIDSFARRGHYWLRFQWLGYHCPTVASFPILLLVYSALAWYHRYRSLFSDSQNLNCQVLSELLYTQIRFVALETGQCYMFWEPSMRKLTRTLVSKNKDVNRSYSKGCVISLLDICSGGSCLCVICFTEIKRNPTTRAAPSMDPTAQAYEGSLGTGTTAGFGVEVSTKSSCTVDKEPLLGKGLRPRMLHMRG